VLTSSPAEFVAVWSLTLATSEQHTVALQHQRAASGELTFQQSTAAIGDLDSDMCALWMHGHVETSSAVTWMAIALDCAEGHALDLAAHRRGQGHKRATLEKLEVSTAGRIRWP